MNTINADWIYGYNDRFATFVVELILMSVNELSAPLLCVVSLLRSIAY